MDAVTFSLVQHQDLDVAYGWHRGFVARDDFLLAKPFPQLQAIARSGNLWVAKNSRTGDIQAMAYAVLDGDVWEIGGLMVAVQETGRGLGTTIFSITLGHLLVEEDPLASGQRVVAHAHAQNPMPRGIIQDRLKFETLREVEIPKGLVPGLRADADGFVRGTEFGLKRPETLDVLADWANGWNGVLRDGSPAELVLREGVTMQLWRDVFLAMR